VLFPESGYTKLDVARYFIAVADGALRGAGGRPNVLVRYPNGIREEFFYQKRAPTSRPDWIEVVALQFPSGRTAEEVVPRDAATLVWMANLGCIELHPHPVRADHLDHPDELRVDLDPVPGVPWTQVRDVALVAQATLSDFGLIGWPKTSGSRGMHVVVRIEQRWTFPEVRRAALALAREVERRAPAIATSKWWKEERHGVFVDYNQNAKDRTVASAYSVRPRPAATVSAPLTWDEVPDCEPADFTLATMPKRFAELGDRHVDIDGAVGSLDALLDLSARQEREGEGDAPWPPHYQKQPGEPPRVQPSKRRMGDDEVGESEPAEARGPAKAKGAAQARQSGAKARGAAKGRGAATVETGEAETVESAPKRSKAEKRVSKGNKAAPAESTAPRPSKSDRGETAPSTSSPSPTGRRVSKLPLLEIGRAKKKADALAGLERWKARHPEAASHLQPEDVLVDSMRGRSSTWTRIRVNLQHVPEELRPSQEPLDPDYDARVEWEGAQWPEQ
jgi:bifunctional non-homologous end joining protein LigD